MKFKVIICVMLVGVFIMSYVVIFYLNCDKDIVSIYSNLNSFLVLVDNNVYEYLILLFVLYVIIDYISLFGGEVVI